MKDSPAVQGVTLVSVVLVALVKMSVGVVVTVALSVVVAVGLEQPQDTESSSVVTSTESLVESVKP